jgi:2-haloacid dehalogenase
VAQELRKFEGIQAVVFDAYGTLFDVTSPIKKLSADLGDKADALAPLWRQKQLEYTWLRSLMGVHADFWTVTRDALNYCFEKLEISETGLADELMTLYLKLDVFPDVIEGLTTVKRKGRRTAILSNGSPSMLDSIVRHAAIDKLIDHTLSIEDVGIYKPSRRAYRLAMQKLALQDTPSICFVSANPWDAQAASHFGFQVAKIARVPSIDDQIPGKAARVVATIGEVAECF